MLAGHFTAKLPDKQLCVFISFLFVLDINKLHKMMFISIIYFSLVGQLVNGMQFQAFLLDGPFRWNRDRNNAAVQGKTHRNMEDSTMSAINRKAELLFGSKLFLGFQEPIKNTGK